MHNDIPLRDSAPGKEPLEWPYPRPTCVQITHKTRFPRVLAAIYLPSPTTASIHVDTQTSRSSEVASLVWRAAMAGSTVLPTA
jgi:hypothetical protein